MAMTFQAEREPNPVSTTSLSPPGRMVIVYDGNCAFCRRSILEIRRRDRDKRFLYMPRQTPGIEVQYPQATVGDFDTGLRLIDSSGDLYIGADAIHQIVSRLPVWRRLAWAYRVPLFRTFAKWAYARVAANRMQLSHYCTAHGVCIGDQRDTARSTRTEKE
jgi:predicted DCC family thiol-disulfide oxidoreductase YuxK